MDDTYANYIYLAGLAVITVGCLGLIIRAFRHWRKGLLPLGLIGLGLVIMGFPPAYELLVPIDLGSVEKLVDGERHLTLTGWDRKDYALLGSKRDVVVSPDGKSRRDRSDFGTPQGDDCPQEA